MQTKLIKMNVFIKILLAIALLGASVFSFNTELDYAGYILLFSALYVVNEGFGFSLFVKILLALVLGIIIAWSGFYGSADLVAIRPVGSKIFMNCLTMALVPLVFSSIVTGVTSLGDINKLNKIGLRTIAYYIVTTAIAITIGLVLANTFQPGKNLDTETRAQFEQSFKTSAATQVVAAKENKQTLFEGLQAIFPTNIFESISKAKSRLTPGNLGTTLYVIDFSLIASIK